MTTESRLLLYKTDKYGFKSVNVYAADLIFWIGVALLNFFYRIA